MGDPVTTSVIVAGASTAAQTYLGGRQARNQSKIQAAQMATEQKAIETNAAIEQAERLNKLKAILASQNALFAMAGQTAGVGSAAAIQAGSMSNAAKEQRLSNLQRDVASSAMKYNVWSSKKAAKTAMANTLISTGLNVATRVGTAYAMNSFKPVEEE